MSLFNSYHQIFKPNLNIDFHRQLEFHLCWLLKLVGNNWEPITSLPRLKNIEIWSQSSGFCLLVLHFFINLRINKLHLIELLHLHELQEFEYLVVYFILQFQFIIVRKIMIIQLLQILKRYINHFDNKLLYAKHGGVPFRISIVHYHLKQVYKLFLKFCHSDPLLQL